MTLDPLLATGVILSGGPSHWNVTTSLVPLIEHSKVYISPAVAEPEGISSLTASKQFHYSIMFNYRLLPMLIHSDCSISLASGTSQQNRPVGDEMLS